jgi:hypothetical protein
MRSMGWVDDAEKVALSATEAERDSDVSQGARCLRAAGGRDERRTSRESARGFTRQIGEPELVIAREIKVKG